MSLLFIQLLSGLPNVMFLFLVASGCGIGSCGVPRPSLAPYFRGIRAQGRVTAAGARSAVHNHLFLPERTELRN
jgi:hypothetical protein